MLAAIRRPMLILSCIACLAAGAGTASAQLPPPPPEMPRPVGGLGMLKFEVLDFDFGNIWDHEKATHAFKFYNTGTERLTILDIRSTCGCTVPELDKKVYEPGESGEMLVIFNPENRVGHQEKSITVTTDSRTTPSVRLSLRSHVTKVLHIDPPMANLARIYKNEEKGLKVQIVGTTPDFEAWPEEDQPESGPFRVELVTHEEVEVDGQTRRVSWLRVWVEPGLSVGRHTGELAVRTNDSRRPAVALRATVTVIGDLQGRPPRFALGRLDPEQEYQSTARVVHRLAEPFRILRIETTGDIGQVKASFAPATEGKLDAYDITITGLAPGNNERILGQIIIHTDMPAEPVFELPIYGFVNALTRPSPQVGGSD